MTEPQMLAEVRKFSTAILGAAAIAVTQGLVSGTAARWTASIIAIATALGVYVVPNAMKASTPTEQPAPAQPTKPTTTS